jgi:hypothetical protein
MKHRLSYIWSFVRNFLFKVLNKEFLIFLFFLILSGIFWLLMTLNETYEEELRVPVHLVDVPKNAVMTTDMTDTVAITVRDKGFTLATYVTSHKILPVNVSFDDYANSSTGKVTVPVGDIQKQVIQQLYGSSRITVSKPDKLVFYFNYGRSKQVPVRLAGRIIPGKSYYLAGQRFWPQKITIYANKKLLDSIRYVSTVDLNIVNFDDTVIQTVALKSIKGVKIVPSMVRIGLYPDILTEESVDVPISAVNMPQGKVLRTFPSKVSVRFTVGASMFRMIKPEQFKVIADYNDLTAHPSDKCNIYLRVYPHNVTKAHLDINKVDYLIEQQ